MTELDPKPTTLPMLESEARKQPAPEQPGPELGESEGR